MKLSLQKSMLIFLLFIGLISYGISEGDEDTENQAEEEKADPEKLDYAKGSLCKYCDYCKFCKLCDEDCPCETGPKKPNCHMCKYCKFCYLCKICDTICQPGGIIDTVSSAVLSRLPTHDTEEIDKDIDGVKDWVHKKKDEL